MDVEEQVARLERELLRAQAAGADAREARARAEALIDHIPYIAWMKSLDGVFLAVNEPFARACGHPRARVIGATDRDIWPHELAERYIADDQRVIASRTKVHVEEPVAVTTGTKWFETFKSPVLGPDGRVVATVGLARDITERKQSEERARQLEVRMQQAQKLESLGLLAGGIAHDFNNLLVGVLSNAELAIRHLQRLPDAALALERVMDVRLAALHAAELTNQMLAYSGRGGFVVRSVCLNAVVRGSTQLLQASISKRARLRCALSEPLPPVEVDVAQMRQVVMNLITNASDALGEREGTIEVETGALRLDAPRDVDGAFELAAGPYVFLRVTDDGCGMSEETRARLFDPFYSTKLAGRGLGLSAVQGIVRGHRGGIVVESELGRGTRIEILLPAGDRPAEAVSSVSELPERVEAPPPRRRVVLVADDDDRVLRTTQLALEELGFDVIVAATGRLAIEAFARDADRIDLVLLDLTMPDMSGDQVFRELRALRPHVNVVLASGYDEQDARKRLDPTAVAGFLQKPYSLEGLRGTLEAALERARS